MGYDLIVVSIVFWFLTFLTPVMLLLFAIGLLIAHIESNK